MSEVNRNPDEIEEKSIDLPEGWDESMFVNEDEPQQPTEAVETPEEPVAPETPETPVVPEAPSPRVPALFADVTDPAERKALLEDAIASMSPAERAQLRGVDEVINQAHQMGQRAGAANAISRAQQEGDQEALVEAAETFIERAREYGASPEFKWEDEIANVEQHAGNQRQNDLVASFRRGIGNTFQQYGVTSFPQELTDRLNGEQDFGSMLSHYLHFAVSVGAEAGKKLQSDTYAAQSEADRIAMKARTKNEALGELAKDGRIRIGRDTEGLFAQLVSSDAPAIEGSTPTGATTVDEAEWELAMRDPDAYDRLMADPGKRAFIESLTAEAVGGRR